MLDTLRANSRSVLTYVLFGIIIVVFVVSFGPGSKGCGTPGATATWAAKVNGETLPPGEMEQQYGQLLKLYRQQGLGDLDALLQTRLRQMAVDQVVQRALVEQEAKRQGIAVSDDQLSAAIVAMPAFHTNGAFDQELYKRIVTPTFGTTGKFEEQQRRQMLYERMVSLLRGAAKVSEPEVKEAWAGEADKVHLEFARFPYGAAKAEVKPTDAQVKDFLAQHGARVEQFYKDHPERYDKKKRVHARHVLVKVDEKAAQAAQEAAKQKIDGVAERLKKGEDFAKVAAEVSDDPGSKARGGDLGSFGPGVMTKAFEEAAFALQPGQLSAPVRTPFGWHVIKVEAVEPPELVPLDKARPEIARELVAEDLGKQLALRKAQELLEKVQAGKSLAALLPAAEPAKGKKGPAPMKLGDQVVKPEDTGTFTASAQPNVPRIGAAPALFADALQASAGQALPKAYDTTGGAVVAIVKERSRPDEAKYATQRQEVETRLRLRRESEIERGWLEDLRKRAKVEVNEALVRGEVRASGPIDLE